MADHAIDVHEELLEARLSGFHYRLALFMGLLTLFDGYDTFNPAYVIHYITEPWGLSRSQAGLLIASGLIGFLFGAAVHGVIADRFGRRGTLLGGLWITSLFTLLTAVFADSFASYCILRVLTGLGLGVLLPLATTYINELAPRRVTNTFALWGVVFGWSLGGTLAGLVGVFATPAFGWTVLYWVGSLSFLLLPFLHAQLPESPKFLLLRNRAEEMRPLLSRLRPERAAIYRAAPMKMSRPQTASNPLAVLLTANYRRTTLAIWLAAFLSLFCIYGMTGWLPTVMMQRGETFSASFGFGAVLQIMSFIGGLTLGNVIDRFGRSRGLMAIWWTIGGAAVLSLTVFNTHLLNLTAVALAGFCFSAQFVLNNFAAASYETGVRATAVGMELAVARFGAILGPLVAGTLQQIYRSPTPMFVSIGLSAIASGAIILFAKRPTTERADSAQSLIAAAEVVDAAERGPA